MIEIKRIAYFICCVFFSVVIFLSGLLTRPEVNLSDLLFQSESTLSGDIALIEIDAKSLEELGPFQSWTRDYMADLINILNSDPNVLPSVIGIDVMYFGNTTEEADKALAEACEKFGNVVTGSLVNFGTALVKDDDGNFYMDNNYINKIEEPYDELKAVTRVGHLNTKVDNDGVLRKSLNSIKLPDGKSVNSFAHEVYKLFSEKNNLEIKDAISVDKNNEFYIPYYANPGGYSDGFSFVDVLNGNINPDVFENKIVLIGAYAPGLMDNYITAINHNESMYGIEVHANVIDTLLNGNFKTYVPKWMQGMIVGIFALLCAIIFEKNKPGKATLYLVTIVLGYLLYACILYHLFGKILDVLCVPLFATIIYVVSIIKSYIKANLEKRKVENTFKRYVAPQIVDKIIKEGVDNIKLGGKSTDIACLFVDIRGFTPMSENLSPEEVVGILNEYLSLTSSCIFDNDGTLDKFIGDATMAIFNAPVQLDDYIYKAVKTAWDIARGAGMLAKRLQEKFGKTVSFGIGVNCGPAVVGNIGTVKRMDYTAIGDTVNTAARLEANAKPGQILISKAVYEAVKDRVVATSIGEIPLKGKSNGVEVFVVENLS